MKLIVLALLLGLIGCKATDDEGVIEKSSITVNGTTDFGYILVGDSLTTSFTLTNDSETAKDIGHDINAPFSVIKSVPNTCDLYTVPAKTKCSYQVKFSPLTAGEFAFYIAFVETVIEFKGAASNTGNVSLSINDYNFGSGIAGSVIEVLVTASNEGGSAYFFEAMPSNYQIRMETVDCGAILSPGESCFLKAVFTPKTASSPFTATLALSTNQESEITFVGEILPDTPSGSITAAVNASMLVGETQIVTTQPVTDEFGNPVATGTVINIGLDKLSFCPSLDLVSPSCTSATAATDSDGRATFTVYAASAGPGTVFMGYNGQTQAYGTYPININ